MTEQVVIMKTSNSSITTIILDLLPEDQCRRFVLQQIYPNGPVCPRCGQKLNIERHDRFYKNKRCRCGACERMFNATSETFFHSIKVKFSEYLLIKLLLELNLRPADVARRLPISKSTAGYWYHKLKDLKHE